MALVTLQDVHVSFGPQVVLDSVNLTVHPGDRMGVVGPNGAGKTTLLKVILGQVQPSIGRVYLARGLRIGYLPQEVTGTDVSLDEYLRTAFATTEQLAEAISHVGQQLSEADPGEQPALLKRLERLQAELDAAGGYRYESRIGLVRDGLQLADIEPGRPMTSLSGGQLARAALARLLLTEPDLLLLDEPTNHLDLQATEWLEQFLLGFAGAMMIISHDRYLLDKLAEKILEVSARSARLFGARFSDYMTTRRIQQVHQQREYEQQQAFIAKEREFIARFHAGQRARQARGRATRLNRRISDGELSARRVRQEAPLSFRFRLDHPGGEMIVRCADLSKRYGDRVLFDRFNLDVTRGQKLGICGPNGVGKTTLLRMMLRQVEPDSGRVRLMENLDVGCLDQHLAGLDEQAQVLASAQKVRPDLPAAQLRGLLARFGFGPDDIDKSVGRLSGGEQTRLALVLMVLAGHQVLLMDEPTNHLDFAGREALEEAMQEYPGTLIVISHDRYFLDLVVNRLLVMGHAGRHEYVIGNYTDYQNLLADRARAAEEQAAEERRRRRPGPAARRSQAPATPEPPADWPEELRPLAGLTVAQLEDRIIQMEAELEDLHARFSDRSLYSDPPRLAELGRQVRALQHQLELHNAAWERRAR